MRSIFSYNSSDYVNKIRWEILEQSENVSVIDFYRGLINFRKAHPALRLATAAEVAKNVTYKWITNELVLFEINGACVENEPAESIVVIFNATTEAKQIDFTKHDIEAGEWSVYINDSFAGTKVLDTVNDGKVTIAPISALVLAK